MITMPLTKRLFALTGFITFKACSKIFARNPPEIIPLLYLLLKE